MRDQPKIYQITDGASNTIMIVEVDDAHAVTWTKPDDLEFDPKAPRKNIGILRGDSFLVAFADGSVQTLPANIADATLAAIFTRAGGEAIDRSKLDRGTGWAAPPAGGASPTPSPQTLAPTPAAAPPSDDNPAAPSAGGASSGPPGGNKTSRTFSLRFRLASQFKEDLRQILADRVTKDVEVAERNQEIIVAAAPEVLNRVATFIAVNDWPDGIERHANYEYTRDSVPHTARSFFYACSIEDAPEVFSKMLSPDVLARLKGDTHSKEYEHYQRSGVPDKAWEASLRGDWPGKKKAIERLVRSWNHYPLKRIVQEGGVAIGFGVKYFCTVSFDGVPKAFYSIQIEPERGAGGNGKESFVFSSLPPWWENDAARDPSKK